MSELPPGYPREWEADVVLRDGSVAQVRPITPDDTEAIHEFHAHQSQESIYLRFFAPVKRLSDKDVHRFTHVDYTERVALVMTANDKLVGIARYDRIGGPSAPEAEVAFNVSDHYQGRGVGSVMLEHLAAIGREQGVREFVADVLPQNRKMMRVFTDAGFTVDHHFDDGVISLKFPIRATQQSEDVRIAREHRAEAMSVRRLLSPQSVAVVGVGSSKVGVGHTIFDQMIAAGFTGRVYAVGRPSTDLPGHEVFAKVTDLPEPVDLAVIAVPAANVKDVVLDCAAHGVTGLLMLSAGFAETGAEGRALQDDLVRTARNNGMRLVGPNSFGIINARSDLRLNASFAPRMPFAGGVGLFAQSGALGIAVLDSAARRGLGISDFVSAGNRADVSGNDLMQHWIDDDSTTAVGLYLESVGNPRKFSRVARRLSERKPVIVVKSGVTAYGVPQGHRVRATQAAPAAFASMMAQAGVIHVETVHQLFDIAQLVVNQPLPKGPRVAIVGNSDALGALAADTALSWSLAVEAPPVNLPPDVSPEAFAAAVREALADENVDSVITAFMPPRVMGGVEMARALADAAAAADKPVITTFLGLHGVAEALRGGTKPDGSDKVVPAYSLPEDGVRALAAVTRYADWHARDKGTLVMPEDVDHERAEALVDRVLEQTPEGRDLTPEEITELLAAYGITLWPVKPVHSLTEAVEAAEELGYPVVVKTVSPIVSAQPISGVRADLRHAAAVCEAYEALDAHLAPLGANRLVVQRMATIGTPCIVAKGEDPLFGPVLSFSLAGAPTEVMGDIGYRIPPLTDVDVVDLVDSVKAAPLLRGHAGAAPVDTQALYDVIARLSVMADQLPEVASLRLNPLNTHAGGAEVLGAIARVAPAGIRTDSDRRSMTNR